MEYIQKIKKNDALDRIFIGGLPHFFTEEQVLDILRPFGEVKTFDIVKDKSTGQCKGYGFCIYRDSSVTDVACNALNGFKLGERSLTVKRALVSHNDQQKNILNYDHNEAINFLDELQEDNTDPKKISRFIIIPDCLTDDDLDDENEYKDIFEDMREMFEQYGLVIKLHIPRLGEKGCGKVIIEYDNPSQAAAAKNGMQGKLFSGKPVVAHFISESEINKLQLCQKDQR